MNNLLKKDIEAFRGLNQKGATLKSWSANIDPATIPDEVLKSERARRNALKRESYTGGVFWRRHNPKTPRCRFESCMKKRQGG